MGDLYGSTGAAISMGNAHMKSVRDFNDRVRQHNFEVADRIQSLRDQEKTTNIIQQAKDQATNLWTAKDIPGKVKAYNDYYANKASGAQTKASNPLEDTQNTLRESAAGDSTNMRNAMSEGQLTEAAGGEAKTALKGADKAVVSGLAKDGENLLNKTKLGAIGEKVGVLGSAAMGGMDLYEDIKSGKIAGNNTWEKAGNVLQIGGAAADIIGTFFPPAKLVGGILDLSSGITESIGEKLDSDKQSDDLKNQQAAETEKPEEQVSEQVVATARTQ